MKYDLIKKWYKEVIKQYINDIQASYKYSREITILLTVIMLASIGFWGYRWWKQKRDADAQRSFGECLYSYQEALQGRDESWSSAAMLCNIGYEHHQSSSLAPYFLIFYADTLLKQGKQEEARETIEKVISMVPSDSPLLSLYKTKLALVQLDDKDPSVCEAGFNALKILAENEENKNRDMALYYLGLYYWTQNKKADAHAVWQQLVETFKQTEIGASPWASLARTKLEQVE